MTDPIPGRPTAINRRADVTPEERAARAEIARTMNSLRESFKGGRPRSEDRCPCGRFTRLYATAYGHKCQAPDAALQAENKNRALNSPVAGHIDETAVGKTLRDELAREKGWGE